MLHYIYYFYFIIALIEVINTVDVENENDVISNLSVGNKIVTLSIKSEINITEEIKISSSIQKLYISGNSLDSAKLNLEYPIYFDTNIEEIEMKNINIKGVLFFKKNNKKITLDTVNLNGYINSEFDNNNNNNIKITKLTYKPTEEPVENCINLSGNININNSKFYGNSSCRNRLLHFNGFGKYTFDLKDSSFNGEYECPFLSIENAFSANVETSDFEKGYSSKNIDGGAGIIATSSNLNIQDCTFNDILSFNDGGAFNFNNNIQVEGSNLNFNNVTSLGLGSIFQISSLVSTKHIFNNIFQQNTGDLNNMREGGLIMNVEGNAEVDITTYQAEKLINRKTSGSAIILSNSVKVKIRNMYIKELIGNGEEDGLFYTSHDSTNVDFTGYNITLYNLFQLNKFETSIIYLTKNNYPIIDGLKLFNSGGYNTNFINILNHSIITLSNLEVDNFESKTNREFVNSESENVKPTNDNTIHNCKISNIISPGVLFRIKNGSFYIYDCEFRKIHECYKYNNCTSLSSDKENVEDAVLMIADGFFEGGNFISTTLDQVYGERGSMIYSSKFIFDYSSVSNSYFKNGFFYYDERYKQSGALNFTNSNFENNTSESGTILNLPYYTFLLNIDDGLHYIENCTFVNNTASKFGGVIYSGKNANRLVITNCVFNDNHAKSGNIVYAYSQEFLPSIEDLNNTDVSTIPSYFILDESEISENEVNEIYILSGENIPEGIKFKSYDEYGNQIYFPEETSNIQFEDLVLFNIEVNDTYNAKVVGQTNNYCWNEFCTFPPVKVIGNAGTYTLSLKIKSYGIYPDFAKDSIDIEVKIHECNESSHLNQAIGNTHLKSCYFPQCEFDCSGGQCINNDVCDCEGTGFIGRFCNEYVILERYSILDNIAIITAFVIIFIILVIILLTFSFKDNPAIKGGGFEFLIIILIGLIINVVNIIFLTQEKTSLICYLTYIFSNMGFSFVFGSIFVKSFRIYRIFFREKKSLGLGFSQNLMYLIIALMTLFHWLIAFLWAMFNKINAVNDYTADNRLFIKCVYPSSKNISTLFNFVILILEFAISYAIRGVQRKFREALTIPAYTYIVYTLFMYLVGGQSVINVVIKDYFDIIGTIINTLISIYYLYITKFIDIYTEASIDSTRKTYVRVM